MSTDPKKYFWYLNSLTAIRVSAQQGQNGLSVIEQRAPKGNSPPLHIHRTQDELYHILEGEFRYKIGDDEHQLKEGDLLLAPRGIPHTYIIESTKGGRWLTITVGADFENFVRALARPAERIELPESGEDTSPENVLTLTMTAAQFGIDIVGPALELL